MFAPFLLEILQDLALTAGTYKHLVQFSEEDGFNYGVIPAERRARAIQHAGPIPPNFDLTQLECELIEVTSEIPPHFHTGSMAALLLVQRYSPKVEMFRGEAGSPPLGAWTSMPQNHLLLIPPEQPHGFRGKCLLVGVNYPPIEDDDVTYL